jgi:hypothetical protein
VTLSQFCIQKTMYDSELPFPSYDNNNESYVHKPNFWCGSTPKYTYVHS